MPELVLNAYGALAQWVNAALGFVYPEVCELCGANRATPDRGYVCDNCRAELTYITAPICDCCGLPYQGEFAGPFTCRFCLEERPRFAWARAAVLTKGKVLDAIHKYKYSQRVWLEKFLAELLICSAQPGLVAVDCDCIVPVPLHPVKLRERGFNQAERLARRLGKATGLPVRTDLVRRARFTPTQTYLGREERRENMRGAFATQRRSERRSALQGERILLVDDVFTTGATASACAESLLRAGAGEVCVWTVARGT